MAAYRSGCPHRPSLPPHGVAPAAGREGQGTFARAPTSGLALGFQHQTAANWSEEGIDPSNLQLVIRQNGRRTYAYARVQPDGVITLNELTVDRRLNGNIRLSTLAYGKNVNARDSRFDAQLQILGNVSRDPIDENLHLVFSHAQLVIDLQPDKLVRTGCGVQTGRRFRQDPTGTNGGTLLREAMRRALCAHELNNPTLPRKTSVQLTPVAVSTSGPEVESCDRSCSDS
jgi:hypothetical protein